MKASDASLGGALSALPDFGLAATFLVTWIAPHALGARMVFDLTLVMLLEFIVVHSSAFMGNVLVGDLNRRKKTAAVLGLGAFYSLFVAGFSLGFHTWWPMLAFWGLTLNRLLSVLLGQAPTGREKTLVMGGWAISVAC